VLRFGSEIKDEVAKSNLSIAKCYKELEYYNEAFRWYLEYRAIIIKIKW
jgi:hypothetical protein